MCYVLYNHIKDLHYTYYISCWKKSMKNIHCKRTMASLRSATNIEYLIALNYSHKVFDEYWCARFLWIRPIRVIKPTHCYVEFISIIKRNISILTKICFYASMKKLNWMNCNLTIMITHLFKYYIQYSNTNTNTGFVILKVFWGPKLK